MLRFARVFAPELSAIELELGRLQLVGDVVWLPVVETLELRGWHERLSLGLGAVVADPSAPFDGIAYRFHLTLAFSQGRPGQLEVPSQLLEGRRVWFRELGVFVGVEECERWTFVTALRLPLGVAG